MSATENNLSDNEKQLLAREVAADKHVDGSGYCNDNMREVFVSGWDAALQWVQEQVINHAGKQATTGQARELK